MLGAVCVKSTQAPYPCLWLGWSVHSPEGQNHIQNGTSVCAFSQGAIISQKLSFAHSHGKSSHELNLLVTQEVIEVDICESNWFTIFVPPLPPPSLVLVCASLYCSLTGSFDSSKISHKTILLGSGTILKRLGIWWGAKQYKNWGEFVVSSIVLAGEGILYDVFLAGKLLTVAFYAMLGEIQCKLLCCLDPHICLYLIFVTCPKICLTHPALCCGAVRHQEGAISTLQAIGKDVNPLGYNCCK